MSSTNIDAYVAEKIASGQFADREALAAEAIRVYRALEEQYAGFKGLVADRIAQADRGELEPFDAADIAAIVAELSAERDAAGA